MSYQFEGSGEALPSPINPLERRDKLHVYALVSIHKDTPISALKEKVELSLIAAYSLPEAIESTKKIMTLVNKEPEDFILPHLHLAMPVEQLVDIKSAFVEVPKETLEKLLGVDPAQFNPGVVIPNTPPVPIEKSEHTKSKDQLASYVHYVFGKAGTKDEKKVAKAVVRRFIAKGVEKSVDKS